MKKRSIPLHVLFIIWFLLFQRSTETNSIHYDDGDTEEEVTTVTDESDTLLEDETQLHPQDTFNTTSDDIIHLNVGGQKITTYRSTLTVVPHSKLALMFAKESDNKTKTKNVTNSYFFDYNPVQFEYLLNQLRTLKRMPEKATYELVFQPPSVDVKFNFSDMLVDLGLNAERFLSPQVGTHVDLKVSSLVGWKMCYRGKYDVPFNMSALTNRCQGKRLLVGCRSVLDRRTLTVAGVGKREDLFQACSQNNYCSTRMYGNTGFYYARDQAWGFYGRPQSSDPNVNQYSYQQHGGSIHLNPCDLSDEYSQYRLCWSFRSSVNRGGGDRCGSVKNLHNTKGWERIIYEIV